MFCTVQLRNSLPFLTSHLPLPTPSGEQTWNPQQDKPLNQRVVRWASERNALGGRLPTARRCRNRRTADKGQHWGVETVMIDFLCAACNDVCFPLTGCGYPWWTWVDILPVISRQTLFPSTPFPHTPPPSPSSSPSIHPTPPHLLLHTFALFYSILSLSFTNLSHPIHRFSIPSYFTLSNPILICHTVPCYPIPPHSIPLGGHEGEGFEKKKSPHTRPRHGGGSRRQDNLSSLPNWRERSGTLSLSLYAMRCDVMCKNGW